MNNKKLFPISASLLIILAAGFTIVCTLGLDTRYAPDEVMRKQIADFIVMNGYLPWGDEPELITVWGFNYSFSPYFPTILGSLFMKAASLFTDNPYILLAAFRQVSTISVIGTGIYSMLIAQNVFHRYGVQLLFVSLSLFLPQFLYLASYFNNDIFSIFLGYGFVYCWIRALRNGWTGTQCVHLGILCGLMSITYYFGYAYLLASLIVFCISCWKEKTDKIYFWSRFVIVFLIAFTIGGWWFIKNANFMAFDFLGFKATEFYQEMYGQNLNLLHPADTMSFIDMIFKPVGQGDEAMLWWRHSLMSYIGVFQSMSVVMHWKYYVFYFLILGSGFITGFVFSLKSFIKMNKNRLFMIALVISIVLPVFLSAYNSYVNDYQPQGRYMMSSLCAVMLCVAYGFSKLETIFDRAQGWLLNTVFRIKPDFRLSLSLITALFFCYKGLRLYYLHNAEILFTNLSRLF